MIIDCRVKAFYKKPKDRLHKEFWCEIPLEETEYYLHYGIEYELYICNLKNNEEVDILRSIRFQKKKDSKTRRNISFYGYTYKYFDETDEIYLVKTEIEI